MQTVKNLFILCGCLVVLFSVITGAQQEPCVWASDLQGAGSPVRYKHAGNKKAQHKENRQQHEDWWIVSLPEARREDRRTQQAHKVITLDFCVTATHNPPHIRRIEK